MMKHVPNKRTSTSDVFNIINSPRSLNIINQQYYNITLSLITLRNRLIDFLHEISPLALHNQLNLKVAGIAKNSGEITIFLNSYPLTDFESSLTAGNLI